MTANFSTYVFADLFHGLSDWQHDWMTGKRFQPGIQRNRFFTNWVVASSGTNKPVSDTTSSGKRKALVMMASAVIVAFGSIFTFQAARKAVGAHSATVRSQSSTPTSTTKPLNTASAQHDCSATGLAKLAVSKAESGFDDLFIQTATTSLGGIRIDRYLCTRGPASLEFSAEWIEVESKWELKKISQLPRG